MVETHTSGGLALNILTLIAIVRKLAEIFVSFLPLQEEALKRAMKLPFEEKQICVTSAEDLIIFKMIFHREKDLRDVKGILWSQRDKIDLAYIRSWASKVLESDHSRELENWIKEYTQTQPDGW